MPSLTKRPSLKNIFNSNLTKFPECQAGVWEKKVFAKEPQLPSIVNTNSQMLYIYCPKHSFSIQDSISTRFKLYLKKKCPADFLKIFGKKIPTNNKSQELFMYPESRCSWCTRSIFIFLRELNTGP